MPGFLVHAGATVLCVHGGQAQPTAPFPRVLVGGLPVATIAAPYVIAGCPFVPVAPMPCLTAQWMTGAVRVLAGGVPVVLLDSQAICAPNGTPLIVAVTQVRVTGT